MKKLLMGVLALFLITADTAFAGQKVVEFTWDKATIEGDLAGFRIYQGDASMSNQPGDATQIYDIPYTPGQTVFAHEEDITCPDGTECTYYYRCAPYDDKGNVQTWSAEEPVVTIDFSAPGGVTNFKAVIKILPE